MAIRIIIDIACILIHVQINFAIFYFPVIKTGHLYLTIKILRLEKVCLLSIYLNWYTLLN